MKDETLLKKVISRYMPYWKWFVAAAVAGLLLARVYLQFATPVYEATATMIIQDDRKGNEESKLTESLNPISSKKTIENETEVLKSRRLMEDVATKLNLYTAIEPKSYDGLDPEDILPPVEVTSPDPSTLKGKSKKDKNITFSYDEKRQVVILNKNLEYPLDKMVTTPFGLLKFSKNKSYNRQPEGDDNRWILTIIPQRVLIPILLKRLNVEETSKLSSTVTLSYRDASPSRAEKVLNQLMNSYRELEIEEKNVAARNALSFINERLDLVTTDLNSIQQRAEQFKSGGNAVDISTQGKLYLQNVSENDQKLSEVSTQISILDQIEKYIEKGESSGMIPSSIGLDDAVLKDMLSNLNNLELEYEKRKTTTGENNPRVLEVKDQIQKLKPGILKNVSNQREILIAMRNNIGQTNRTYNALISQVPAKERQLIEITREEQNKRNLYDFLVQKKEESEIAYASTVNSNRIVDPAQAGLEPVKPHRSIVYLGLFLFFLAIPFCVVELKEAFNRKIFYRKDIETNTRIPIISEIALNQSGNSLVINQGSRGMIAEQFRKLRLALDFPETNRNNKIILITSSISGEGKSFVAANLGISFSLTGKKTIVVDMDLNNPSLDKKFGIKKYPGIAEMLKGEKEVDEIILRLSDFKKLYFIPAGIDLPDSPTELFTKNKRVNTLLDYLATTFDQIIIDTSPIGLVTDGYLLSPLCDLTLYVVRHQFTPEIIIRRLDENNNNFPIHNPAIVFNGVKPRGSFSSQYGYDYGYDYIYSKKYGYSKIK